MFPAISVGQISEIGECRLEDLGNSVGLQTERSTDTEISQGFSRSNNDAMHSLLSDLQSIDSQDQILQQLTASRDIIFRQVCNNSLIHVWYNKTSLWVKP
jgi:hypothetical protein